MCEQSQKDPNKYFTELDPFFDDHQEFRYTVDVTALEAMHHTQHAVQVCRDYFYYCMSSPRMAQVMRCRPFCESALITGLKASLDTFNAKVAVLAAECRTAARDAAISLMRQLDEIDPRRPELANRIPKAIEPLLEERWQAREEALKADIRKWH